MKEIKQLMSEIKIREKDIKKAKYYTRLEKELLLNELTKIYVRCQQLILPQVQKSQELDREHDNAYNYNRFDN